LGIYRGSEWRKWDLHVHTPASYTQQFGDDWDAYVGKLIEKANEHGIEVMGVTDYFSVDGYEKLTNEYAPLGKPRLALGNDKYLNLLPCIELRTNQFTTDGASLNVHVLFDSDIQSDLINNYFLNKLNFRYRGVDLSFNEETLIRIGHSESTGGSFNSNQVITEFDDNYKTSCKSKALSAITLDFSTIETQLDCVKKVLEENGVFLNQNYLLAIAAKGHGSLEDMPWFVEDVMSHNTSRPNEVKIDLLNRASITFTRTDSNIDFMHGKNTDCLLDEFKSKFGSIKACIWGSDAHDLDTLFHPSAGQTDDYTWIKADPTFEGLRQIILEPLYRVKIQPSSPQAPIYKLENIELGIPSGTQLMFRGVATNFCFDGLEEKLTLSPYFNCFVGGRGVGKSTLLNLIDECYSDGNEAIEQLNVAGDDGRPRVLKDYINIDEGVSSAANIDFISQNSIEELATDLSAFTSYIYGRVNKHGGSDLESFEAETADEIDSCKANVHSLSLLKEIEEDISVFDKEIASKEKIVNSITDESYIQMLADQKRIIKEKDSLEASMTSLHKLVDKIKMIIDEEGNTEVEVKGEVINNFLVTHNELIEGMGLLIEPFSDASKFENKFGDEQAKLTQLSLDEKVIGERIKLFLEEKGVVAENIEDLSDANRAISELKAKKESSLVRKNKLESEKYVLDKDFSLRIKYEEAINSSIKVVNANLIDIRADSPEIEDIELSYEFDNDSALEQLAERLRLLLKSEFNLAKLPDARVIRRNILNQTFGLNDKSDILQSLQEGDDSGTETAKHLKAYIESNFNYEILENSHHLFFGDVNEFMRLRVSYGGKFIEATSFGQRCTAALIILLALGNHPIVIDEPEAHLDSSLIANYLVGILKKLKERRQIIFATHNANFVINGDADLIYVMESGTNNVTKFTPTTIEDIGMRESLLKLEVVQRLLNKEINATQ